MVREAINTVHTMWLREMIKFWHSKSRIIAALITPFSFMVFLGPGLIAGFQFREGGDIDIGFFAPGLIGMAVLFASLFSGVSVIWDREVGILKGVLIAPVSRFFVALGKIVGGATIAMIQGILMLIIAIFIFVHHVSFIGVSASIIIMFLTGIGFTGLAIALASKIRSLEGFQMVMSFVAMPLVLISGAFFPIADLPLWLKCFVYANPLTYGVEALRWCLSGRSTIHISLCITVMTLFAIIILGVAGKLFGKMRV